MTAAEREAFEQILPGEEEQYLLEVWTAKEAIFKSKGLPRFFPKETDTLSATIKTDHITIANESYIWSVATSTPERIRVYTSIDLSQGSCTI